MPVLARRFAFIRVGTLDTPAALPPDIHIYTSTKLDWVQLPEGLPAMPDYYNLDDIWPSDSIERKNQLFGQ